ncbi:MAG: hypothetical protein Q4D61_06890 [Cardiobacteriaceae bacterium]|nr:hypothetical protein [Cardiobacteriaceae bacterium]
MTSRTLPILALFALPALALDLPQGWQSKSEQGFTSYSPNASGDALFAVIALDPLPLQGKTLDAWATTLARELTQGYGTLREAGTPQCCNPVWQATHRLDHAGKSLFASYTAMPRGADSAQMLVLLGEENPALLAAHMDSAAQLIAALTAGEAAPSPAATALAQALESEGATLGGPFTYGTYRCDIENGRYPYTITFQLYDNGEYRSDSGAYPKGTFEHNPAKGTVSIESGLNLSNFSLGGEVIKLSIYFKDKHGRAYIRGHDIDDDEGTLCTHLGDATDLSPSAEEAAKSEARRFKWTTAPDAGVPLAAIETILYHGEHKNDSLGIRLEEEHLLLMKDGWAYNGLRVTPADLDLAASRQNEPERWQRWRKNSGQYQLERNGEWYNIPGIPARPATRGERLSGAYSHSSMYGNIYTTAHTFKDTLYFKRDGTMSGSSSVRGGTTAMNHGTFSANVASDRIGDETIRYELDGYTLIRHYPDGATTRSLAFFWGDGQEHLNINGTTYSME